MTYNDKLVYKEVIWVFWGIILWKEKEALTYCNLLDPWPIILYL